MAESQEMRFKCFERTFRAELFLTSPWQALTRNYYYNFPCFSYCARGFFLCSFGWISFPSDFFSLAACGQEGGERKERKIKIYVQHLSSKRGICSRTLRLWPVWIYMFRVRWLKQKGAMSENLFRVVRRVNAHIYSISLTRDILSPSSSYLRGLKSLVQACLRYDAVICLLWIELVLMLL